MWSCFAAGVCGMEYFVGLCVAGGLGAGIVDVVFLGLVRGFAFAFDLAPGGRWK